MRFQEEVVRIWIFALLLSHQNWEPVYCKVASCRLVYYSILENFGQRSQYISIKFLLPARYFTVVILRDVLEVARFFSAICHLQGLWLCLFFNFGSYRQKYMSQIWFEEGFGNLRCGHFINYNKFLLNQWCASSIVQFANIQIFFWKKEFKCIYCEALFIILFLIFLGVILMLFCFAL